MIESVNLNWNTKVITVTLEDGTTKEYTQADEYIAEHPTRIADAVAMGWIGGSDNSGWADQ
jgi:hypothetical protein